MSVNRWISLQGAVNARDVGGLVGSGGPVPGGRLLRSDNPQDLTETDVMLLVDQIGITDVIDLRSTFEVAAEGPGPLSEHAGVTVHHLSFLPESDAVTRKPTAGELLPWQEGELAERGDHASYLGYLSDRPDSVLAALRVIGTARGAVLVHCAAGKDRTGVLTALALTIAGVPRADIVADYMLTDERIQLVLDRLAGSPTYAHSVVGRPLDSMRPKPDAVTHVLDALDADCGGLVRWLGARGFGADNIEAVRRKLR
ncbi:MAG: tyrosine-protein phosphatase [Mycobacteriales bacterium]